MMKGVIDYLVGPSIGARILRDNFIFKIIPMMNPDGVILGNTRCSLVGLDLNRMWQEPTKEMHPVIYYLK
jgi:murein tripeptide amidase MpaA